MAPIPPDKARFFGELNLALNPDDLGGTSGASAQATVDEGEPEGTRDLQGEPEHMQDGAMPPSQVDEHVTDPYPMAGNQDEAAMTATGSDKAGDAADAAGEGDATAAVPQAGNDEEEGVLEGADSWIGNERDEDADDAAVDTPTMTTSDCIETKAYLIEEMGKATDAIAGLAAYRDALEEAGDDWTEDTVTTESLQALVESMIGALKPLYAAMAAMEHGYEASTRCLPQHDEGPDAIANDAAEPQESGDDDEEVMGAPSASLDEGDVDSVPAVPDESDKGGMADVPSDAMADGPDDEPDEEQAAAKDAVEDEPEVDKPEVVEVALEDEEDELLADADDGIDAAIDDEAGQDVIDVLPTGDEPEQGAADEMADDGETASMAGATVGSRKSGRGQGCVTALLGVVVGVAVFLSILLAASIATGTPLSRFMPFLSGFGL